MRINYLKVIFFIILLGLLLNGVCLDIYSDSKNGLQNSGLDFVNLSIEELMDIEVSSVSKKDQKVLETASAIFVVTNEEIRRSGFTSIPEVLRMVPGLQVARISSNKWAITSRGFNSIFANKLLVMIDGRSVYSPLFAGVYWDVQDVLLEDVERIEVIRGPGGTVWGANAVNGVINIITKEAKDSQGLFVTAGIGDEERGFGGFRYGDSIGNDAYYRVYAKYFNRDDFEYYSGKRANDEWEEFRGGFRFDWDISGENSLTLQGDAYNGINGQTLTLGENIGLTFKDSTEVAGGNVLARWAHNFSETSDMSMQLYYDRTERKDSILDQIHNTIDLDFFHRFLFGKQHEISWGAGYRFLEDDIDDVNSTLAFDPSTRINHSFNTFMQDEITMIPEKLKFIFGAKFEYNDYTGFEIQPSMRFLWTPQKNHTFWAAVSRAVRSPSRADNDVTISVNPPFDTRIPILVNVRGNKDSESENVIANEIGYRVLPSEKLTLDFAAFYNIYDDLIMTVAGEPALDLIPPPQILFPLGFDNKMDGETYGIEIAANYQATDYWRLFAGYTYLQIEMHPEPAISESVLTFEEDNPNHQFQLRSYLNLPFNLEFDTSLYYVEGISNGDASSYFRLNSRIGWKISEKLDMSIVFQDMLDSEHKEFNTKITGPIPDFQAGIEPTETERSIYGQITLRY